MSSPNRNQVFSSVEQMLATLWPKRPVYCVYPSLYQENTRRFLQDFPGRVLFAVKANDDPAVLRELHSAGVAHFDCASLAEIALISEVCPGARCYLMVPVWIRGEAQAAQAQFAVRHFMIDHADALNLLAGEIDLASSVVFTRMAVEHHSASENLSSKFGADPRDVPGLLELTKKRGAEPALAFNVGTGVTSPDAYRHAIAIAAEVLQALPFRIRLVDIGGGFARSYPDFTVPPMRDYLAAVSDSASALPLAADGEIMCEPGRALAAPGLSAVVEVLLRKNRRLYINDGMYGIFWELRFLAHKSYPVRVFRNGRPHEGEKRPFTLYGPTCDSTDVLPGKVDLPVDIQAGDQLEFGSIGAYSLSGRTRFNGHFSDQVVIIEGEDRPPSITEAVTEGLDVVPVQF